MRANTRRRIELQTDITAALASLGDDAAEVATRLRDVGIRAKPGDGSDCPIARYLSPFVAGHDGVRSLHVTGKCVIIQFARAWRFPLMVPLPWALRDFIAEFDRRGYPDLIRAPADNPR